MEYPIKLQHLSVVTERCSNDTAVIKSLMVLHKDVLNNIKMASKAYCLHGLMDALLNLCRTSRNLLITILSTNLLYTVCSSSEDLIGRFFQLKGHVVLTAMISARDNSGKGDEVMNQTLLLHEHATKFLAMIAGLNSKYQHELVELGIIQKLVDLCSIFSAEGAHRNCCYSKIKYKKEGINIMKQLIEGRKLVGKVDSDQSVASLKGSLNVLAVELFDTTTNEDVNINKRLIEHGIAWPEDKKDEDESNKVLPQMTEDPVWMDFYITKVVDAHCFWALIDKKALETIEKLSSMLEEYIYSLNEWRLDNVKCGMKVCVSMATSTTTNKWRRGCVMEIDEENKACVVLLVDYGYSVRIKWNHLAPLPIFADEMPNQAYLCVLKGIRAAPMYPNVLKYAAEGLSNISCYGHNIRMQVHQLGGTAALLKLCKLGNDGMEIASISALSNLALNHNIRWQIGTLNGLTVITNLLQKHYEDNMKLTRCLSCLLNFIVENTGNRKLFALKNGLLVLMKIYRAGTTDYGNKELVLRIMKNLIGDGWRLLDPVNVPDVRGIIEEQIDTVKGSFNLPNLCGDDLMEEVKKRRSRKSYHKLRDCEADPQPIYASVSVNDLVKKLKGGESCSSDGGCDTRSEGYKTGPDTTDSDDTLISDRVIIKKSALKSYEGYIYQHSVGFAEDETHAFMHEENIRKVKAIEIGDTVCAILNHNVGGIIYVGVKKSSQVIGINITRRERDNLRLGVDDLLERFFPRVKHDKYELKFVPVKHGTSIENLEQYEERYIIEIHVARNIDKLYQTPSKKMLFRDGIKNCELNIQQIREKTIREQEVKYQTEIKALQMTLQEARRGGQS